VKFPICFSTTAPIRFQIARWLFLLDEALTFFKDFHTKSVGAAFFNFLERRLVSLANWRWRDGASLRPQAAFVSF